MYPDLSIPGYNVISNVNVVERGTAIALRDHLKFSHVESSLDSRLICLRLESNATLCNVYAPSGSQRRAEREEFFEQSLPFYVRNACDNVILVGDFNCVLESKDVTGARNFSLSLRNAGNNMGLCDSWEALRGYAVEFSYVTSGSGSRKDRCYVSSSLKTQLRATSMHVFPFLFGPQGSHRSSLPTNRAESYAQQRLLATETTRAIRTKSGGVQMQVELLDQTAKKLRLVDAVVG